MLNWNFIKAMAATGVVIAGTAAIAGVTAHVAYDVCEVVKRKITGGLSDEEKIKELKQMTEHLDELVYGGNKTVTIGGMKYKKGNH